MLVNNIFSLYIDIHDSDLIPCDRNSRGVKVQNTLKAVQNYLSKMSITRVADVTHYDRLGIAVYTATRVNVSDNQISATQGKGMCNDSAKTSALMEAVERHFCKEDLDGRFYTLDQLKQQNIRFYLPEHVELDIHANAKWRTAKSLLTGDEIEVPVAEFAFPYNEQSDELRKHIISSTTGVASGNTPLEATYQACCEVVERHFTALFYQGNIVPNKVTLEQVDNPELCKLIRVLNKEMSLLIFDLSKSSKIPTFITLSWDDTGIMPPIFIGGQGCHVCPDVALRRALLECAQSRVVAIQGSREDLIRHGTSWHKNYSEAEANWLNLVQAHQALDETSSCLSAKDIKLSTLDMMNKFVNTLPSLGLKECLIVDRRCNFAPFSVVSVLIPGLSDTYPKYVHRGKYA